MIFAIEAQTFNNINTTTRKHINEINKLHEKTDNKCSLLT